MILPCGSFEKGPGVIYTTQQTHNYVMYVYVYIVILE